MVIGKFSSKGEVYYQCSLLIHCH